MYVGFSILKIALGAMRARLRRHQTNPRAASRSRTTGTTTAGAMTAALELWDATAGFETGSSGVVPETSGDEVGTEGLMLVDADRTAVPSKL